MLVGFSGAVLGAGEAVRSRMGISSAAVYASVWAGVALILLPTLAGEALGIAGGLFRGLGVLLALLGLLLEYAAWTAGLGAFILNRYLHRRRRVRAFPAPPVPAPPVAPPPVPRRRRLRKPRRRRIGRRIEARAPGRLCRRPLRVRHASSPTSISTRSARRKVADSRCSVRSLVLNNGSSASLICDSARIR